MKRLSLEEKLRTYSCFQVHPWIPPIPAAPAPAGSGSISSTAGTGPDSTSAVSLVSPSREEVGKGSILISAETAGAGLNSAAAAGSGGEAPARKRTPGRWRRIPRKQPPPPPGERYDANKTLEELLAENEDRDEDDYFLTEEQTVLFRETKREFAKTCQILIDVKNGKSQLVFELPRPLRSTVC
uniref:Uncharacterized protein n=1 Tax=Leersia perrieri TaxID=77586 RepID=A0A0D9WJ52_9ORYZ